MGFYSPVIREHVASIQHFATGRMLDVGCGDKPYYDQFQNVTNYIGIDIPASIDIARANSKRRVTAVDVYSVGQCLPFINESFDSVATFQVIAHLPDPFQFIGEISRVLKKDGILIITYPMVSPFSEAPQDYFRYTEYGMLQLCNTFHLEIIEQQRMGGGWQTIGFLIRHLLLKNHENTNSSFLKKIYAMLAIRLYNFCCFLDKKNDHSDIPLNYLTVARKTYKKNLVTLNQH